MAGEWGQQRDGGHGVQSFSYQVDEVPATSGTAGGPQVPVLCWAPAARAADGSVLGTATPEKREHSVR